MQNINFNWLNLKPMKTSSAGLFWTALLCVACSQLNKPRFDAKAEEEAIRSVLSAQQIAWNNGELEAFMEGFWKSDSLQFISERGVIHGWQEALDSYKKAYPDRAAMGTASFEILEIRPLSHVNFVVMGRFHLVRSVGNKNGVFTLIYGKVDGKWVVIYDHTA